MAYDNYIFSSDYFRKVLIYSVIFSSLLYNPVKLAHSELVDSSPLEIIVEK